MGGKLIPVIIKVKQLLVFKWWSVYIIFHTSFTQVVSLRRYNGYKRDQMENVTKITKEQLNKVMLKLSEAGVINTEMLCIALQMISDIKITDDLENERSA